MFLISSCDSEFLCVLSWQNVSWSYLCSGVTTPLAQRPVWANLYGPPSMAAAPATLPVWTSWTERMDPWEQRDDSLPHMGLQMNGWGSPGALRALMHHAWFTDKYVRQPHHWGVLHFSALGCTGSQHWHEPTQRQRQTGLGAVGRGLTVWIHSWVHFSGRVAHWLPWHLAPSPAPSRSCAAR